MHFAAFDRLVPSLTRSTLPLVIEQSCSRTGSIVKLAILLPLLALMGIAFGLVAAHADEPAIRAYLTERPVAVLQLGLGLLVWMALFAWPANRLLGSLVARRRVEITPAGVRVSERSLGGTRTWTAPLGHFEGLAHHTRTSLSGARHELILVHPDRARSLLVAIADRIDREDVEAMARLLGVAEVPARRLYATARAPRVPVAALRPATT